jgi:hypothetical protein
MDMLIDGYDGVYHAPIIKGKEDEDMEYQEVRDLPTNFIGLSSMAQVYRHKDISDFINNLKGGWFRRSYIAMLDKTISYKEPSVDEKAKKAAINFISNIPQIKGDMVLDGEAMRIFKTIRKDMINDASVVEFGELRDPYKIAKLAAIYAYADGRGTITAEDMMYAQQFDMKCFQDAVSFCRMEHDFVRAFYMLTQREMSENELLREKLMPPAKMQRQTMLEDISAYAIENSAQLAWRLNGGIKQFHIVQYRQDDMVRFSYANWDGNKGGGTPMYDKVYEGRFEDLPNWFTSFDPGVQLTAFELRNQRASGATNRTKDNIIATDMVLFDFDKISREELDHVVQILKGYKFIIRQSSGYTKEAPKVHIYLKLKYRLTVTHDEYKSFYERIVKKFGIENLVDMAMQRSVQPMYELAERKQELFDGNDEFDPRCCITGTFEADFTDTVNNRLSDADFKNLRLKRYLAKVIDTIMQGGDRDNNVNVFVHKAINEIGAEPDEVRKALDTLFSLPRFDETFPQSQREKFYNRIR